jgi:hypothetical protein
MKTYIIIVVLAFLSFGANLDARESLKFYEAITLSYEISPTSFDPPIITETGNKKILLSVFSLGKLIREYQSEDGLIKKIHSVSLTDDSSLDPLYKKGKNYIIESSRGSFYLVYHEDGSGNNKENDVIRFRIEELVKLSKDCNIFTKGAAGGGTSYNKEILALLEKL